MNAEDKKYIYQAFVEGSLQVQAVSKDKKVEWKTVVDALQHNVSLKDQYKIYANNGQVQCTTTGDHSLYKNKEFEIEELFVREALVGDNLAIVKNNQVVDGPINSISKVPSQQYMYDLSVEDHHNFVLLSGLVAHNTFRPPASEKFIQGQTQVFGFVWEDEELYEHLIMAVDDFNSRPPTTGATIDDIVGTDRRWRTTILMRAAAFACFGITMNWILDEFSVDGEERIVVQDEEGNEYSLTMMELFDLMYGDRLKEITDQMKKEVIESMKEVENEVQ